MMTNLIYDRTSEDVAEVRRLWMKFDPELGDHGGLTDEEWAEWNSAGMKGAYNYTDLNRVESAVKTLAAALTSAGYPVEVTPVLKGKSRVPTGYTEVEWIESSGTQYIDTGVSGGNSAAYEIVMNPLTASLSYEQYFAGDKNPVTPKIFREGTGTNMQFQGTTAFNANGLDSAFHNIEYSGGTVKIDGSTAGSTGVGGGWGTLTWWVFNAHGEPTLFSTMRLKSLKMWMNEIIIRDFVPCKNPDGVVGLYDLVEGKFYTTPTAVTLPDGYTQIEYLQSDGLQYIDTGIDVTPSNYNRLKFAVTCEKIGQGQGQSGWLVDGSNVSNAYFYMGTYNGKYYYGCGTADHNTNITAVSGKQTYTLDIPAKKLTVSGSVDMSITTEAVTTSASLYLFGFDYSPVRAYAEKIYASQIYDNGTLVRNMIPARNSAGTLGLYDTVNGAFYTNAGSGTFTAGADIVGFTAGAEIGKAEDREWREGDVLYRPQWATYLDNVQRLRDAYYTLADTGELPEPGDKLGYVGANNIEKVLADIDILLDGMKSIYRRAGTFTAGGSYIRQMIRSI